jgi:uncharacterized membrane protein
MVRGEVMTTVSTATQSLIQHYLDQMASGLKGIDDTQRQDILAEINSHLGERIAELESAGDARAMEHALGSLGDPTQLAAQFVAEARTRFGIRSYAPWTLLRRAACVARTGARGAFIFFIGLVGYAATLGGIIAIVMKPFVPRVGLWVGSWGFTWGVAPSGEPARELLGRYFMPATAVLSFVLACGTTLLLRRMTKKIPFFAKWPSA